MRFQRALATLALIGLANAHAQTAAVVHTFAAPGGTGGLGWAVSEVEDLDGDGIHDAFVGASTGENGVGQAIAYSGRTGAVIHTFTIAGTDFGQAVADAGDLDADGVTDLIGSGRLINNRGLVRAFSGRTGAVLWSREGVEAGGQFGFSISAAGEATGDRVPDVWVGAPNALTGRGQVMLLSGIDGAIVRTLDGPVSTTQNATRFGSGVGRLRGTAVGNQDELVVGAPGVGQAFVYDAISGALRLTLNAAAGNNQFGVGFVFDAGDVNADGKHDLYIGDYNASNGNGAAYVFSGSNGNRMHLFNGTGREGVGPGRGAGDVNRDGFADIIVGSYAFNSTATNQIGRVSVYSGRDGSVMARYNGLVAGSNFGFDAVGVGDVNGDGRDDFLVGASSRSLAYIIAGNIDRVAPTSPSIDARYTGSWFDPSQSGHGLTTEVLAGGLLTFAWYTFTPEGQQAWFVGVGRIQGNRIRSTLIMGKGGRFVPFFVPTETRFPLWGSAELEFDSCLRGRIRYTSDLGFGTGSMELTRLGQPLGAQCVP